MKKSMFALLMMAVLPLRSAGQEAPASTTIARNPVVAVISLQQVTIESTLGQRLAEQLQAISREIDSQRTAKQADLDARQSEVDSLTQSLNAQIGTLSADAADERLQSIRRKEREAQAFVEDGQRQLERMQQAGQQRAAQLQNEYQQQLAPYIEAAVGALGIDILIDAQAALFVHPDFDVSADVVARINAANPT